jgi:hypothetical protein
MATGNETKNPSQKEERTISYEDESQIKEILFEMQLEDFLLVRHTPAKKELKFKKIVAWPETLITGEP